MRISRVVKSNMRRNVKLVLLLAVIWIFLILYFIQGGQKVSFVSLMSQSNGFVTQDNTFETLTRFDRDLYGDLE